MHNINDKQKKVAGIAAILIFVLFSLAAFWFIGKPMIDFVEEPDKFRAWVNNYSWISRVIFIGMVVLQVIIAIIPGEPLEFGAGYAFGAIEGTVLTTIGIAVGAIIVFALVKRFGMSFVEIFFSNEKISRIKFLKQSKKRDFLVFLIFLIPGTPKDILTYFLGLTDMKYSYVIFVSIVGRFPSVITSTISGSLLGEENYLLAIIICVATLIISGIGLLIYNRLCKKNIK